ncbi:tRNA(fMet)-specific endonuclease VapC [bacterium HR07]|uniref:Toxin of toxin-antitoxin system n=1 Tax=Acetithermum autotrophicum TaxID=1446466 RepID=H5SU27_ACEAU|nr:toxin of toxin-antitoxin system [Candidatus Acetothermum autotrophicum]GBC76181.1 tRNA(fMet)-specific endonuclease VapC [bacterium HR07]
MRYVLDNSVLMAAYFPDEVNKPHALELLRAFSEGEVHLLAPHLLLAEAHHAVLKAVRGKRVTLEQGRAIVAALLDLGIPLSTVHDGVFELAFQYGCSGYDATYLRLAQHEGIPLLTADQRLVYQMRRGEIQVIELNRWKQG